MDSKEVWQQRVRAMVTQDYAGWGQASQDRLYDLLTHERSRGWMGHSGAFIVLHEQSDEEAQSLWINDYLGEYQKLISAFYRTRLGKAYRANHPVVLMPRPLKADGDDRFVAVDTPMLAGVFTYADFPLYGGAHGRISQWGSRDLRAQIRRIASDIGCEPIVSFEALEYGSSRFGILAANKNDATMMAVRLVGMKLPEVF